MQSDLIDALESVSTEAVLAAPIGGSARLGPASRAGEGSRAL
jgi:hypothetical protein